MICDKKIEEAARRNADKYRNYQTLSDEDRDKVSVGSFMDCAKWMQKEFLKDLWHPADEEPKKNKSEVCVNCINYGWDMPQCKFCNAKNDYKYYEYRYNDGK